MQAQACALAIHESGGRFGRSAGSALLRRALTVARRTPFGAMLRPPADGAALFSCAHEQEQQPGISK
jgi:hypothetical protein